MTRDGTVGRSDATERSLPLHWDMDPARVMRPRFADSIRASSPSGLREQAGHMTASDLCAARQMISCQAGAIHTCERAMTRDGTVGRSDATEPNLAFHRDIDPVRMTRTRFAHPIRASSPPGLHQQAGHMTASDLCAARQMISCQAGAIHT